MGLGRNLESKLAAFRQWVKNRILLQREELVASNVHLIARLEGGCDNAFLGLDGKVHLVDGTENLIDLANRSLSCISSSILHENQVVVPYSPSK